MEVVIIEDEKPAAEKLLKALRELEPAIQVKKILNSVIESIAWFKENPEPDLVFMDIELTDGLSFKIFDSCKMDCPVIFTTAYDDYWQQAFAHNSIDYLLKPVKSQKLSAALVKYEKMKLYFAQNMKQLLQYIQEPPDSYKKRILVKRGTELIAIKTGDVAFCFAIHKAVCLISTENQKFILDKSLAEIEKELEPTQFFRINRKYLVNINSIAKITLFGKGKLLVMLSPSVSEQVIISNETANTFKTWMDR